MIMNYLQLVKVDRFSRLVIVYSLLLVLVICGAVAYNLISQKKSILVEKERYLRQLAQTFSEHVIRTFDGADQTLRYLRREYQDWKYVGTLDRIADDANAVTRLFNQIAIVNENGRIVGTSVPMAAVDLAKVDLRDRPHFKFHEMDPRDIPRVGEPLVGRVSKQASIQLSRRISDSQGNFRGLMVTSVSPDYFSDFFQKIVHSEKGNVGVTLLGYDGIVRARTSGTSNDFGQKVMDDQTRSKEFGDADSGAYVRLSSIDQKVKLYSYQKIPEYQLVVNVWANYSSIEAEWRDYAVPYLLFSVFFIVVLLVGCFFLLANRRSQLDYVEQLLVREQALEKANAFQARMISSVSHELRTPLTSILGYGSLISSGECNEEIREFGAIICSSAEHLKNVINGILDLSRKEAGKLSAVMESVEIRSVLQKSVDLFAVNAGTKGLKLELEIDPRVPHVILLDRTKFVQIVENLLSNAIKFTETGYVRLTIRVAEDGKRIEFKVEDSGIGVPAADLGRLFEPFYYVKNAQHKKHRGAGLGLNIVREFAELMGGSVAVESAVGRGTTFTVNLPL